jgi:mRNA-degrading endonuclease RelE of RelBE toxin-antitoxin system
MAEKMITVVQTSTFLKLADDFFPKKDDLDELINFLAINPDAGDVVPNTGGCRKLRWPAKVKGAGKRSGYRIYFEFISDREEVWIHTVYAKNEQEDLTMKQRKNIRKSE